MEAVRVRVTTLGLALLTASCPVSLRSLWEGQKEHRDFSLGNPPWHPILNLHWAWTPIFLP